MLRIADIQGKMDKILSEIRFAGKISGMENMPCTREEFERIKAFYKTFKKLTEQPEEIDDFEYEKQKLLCNVEKLWPLIEKFCKQFNISLKREKVKEDRTQAAFRYAHAMSGKADSPEPKSQPQKKELIALDLIKSEIHSCQKPGDSVESGLFPKNLASPYIAKIKLSMHIHRRDKIRQILASVLARLCVYFDEEIETPSSPQKPAETGRNTTPTIGWRLWSCVKRIPRWIYVLVIFLAALLTCLYYLGWLEPIKTFIYNILQLE